MENKPGQLDAHNLSQIINDMMNAKFNDQNPLIQNIKNHVNIEQSIMQEIPQVQNKIDLLQYQNYSPNTDQSTNQQYMQQENIQSPDCSIKKQDNCDWLIMSKIGILSIAGLSIICWILYKYIKSPYNYISMAVSGAAILASDFFVIKYITK